MLIEKATGLSYLVAFCSSHAMYPDDVVNVVDNIFAGKGCRKNIRIMGENEAHFLRVVTDGARGIMFGRKDIEQLLQCVLRL